MSMRQRQRELRRWYQHYSKVAGKITPGLHRAQDRAMMASLRRNGALLEEIVWNWDEVKA